MKKTFVAVLVLFASIGAGQAIADDSLTAARRDLMPVPASVEWQSGRLNIDRKFRFAFEGAVDDRLRAYLHRVMRRLEGRTIFEFQRDAAADPASAQLLISAQTTGNAIPALGDDESYTLRIDGTRIRLASRTTVGAMRGLETLLQLLERDRDGFYFPAVSIDDRPRFVWRGLMIDSARHFQPIEVLKRNLDAMASVKLNVLHWHLTEDQGFRVESKKLPELHLQGSDGDFYTQSEIRDLIKYAADRGIRVMPEFDMPGHATSWLVSHPEIGSAPGPYKIERLPGIFDPTLDPTNEKTYKLLEVFFTEMAALFPDAYMHIGGDENEGKQWNANPKIQEFMKKNGIKDNHALQTYFNKRILKFLQKNGKIMMGWDEIFQPDLPKNVVIHSWRGQKALAEAARQGFMGVLSNGYYIDLMQPASDHYAVDPLPADTTLTADEQKRVLGGEATMWSEWVSPETIDSRIWPRTAAIAERLWSPREVRETDDMYRRLEMVAVRLEELGLTHRKNQGMLFRRLVDSGDFSALRTLISLVEPVKLYRRYQLRPQTMLSPLTGLIDAAQADASGARDFRRRVETVIRTKSGPRSLTSIFDAWISAGESLKVETAKNPALFEAAPLAADLVELGMLGKEIVRIHESGTAPSADWTDAKLKRLAEIAKPRAAVEFQVVEAMKALIAELGKSK